MTTTSPLFVRGDLAHLLHQIGVAAEVGLGDVGDEEHRLHRDEVQLAKGALLLVREVDGAQRRAFVDRLRRFRQRVGHRLRVLLADARQTADAVEPFGDRVEVGEHQLRLDDLDVALRIDRRLDVDDVRIVEAADDVQDRVGLADVGEELVAEPFPFARAANEAGDVDDLQVGVDRLLALSERGELVEPRIDDRHDADVRLDRAERIVRALRAGGGQRVEDRRLADVGQTDDSDGKTHA